jgi:hypothetical protein
MKRCGLITALLLVISVACYAGDEEPLEKLIARADAGGDHQAELYARVVQREVAAASGSFAGGKPDDGFAAVNAINQYADKLLQSAQRHPKKLKDAELLLRNATRHLHDLEETLNYDQRPTVKSTYQHLAQVDSALLNIMFAPPMPKR